ncbi:MAG: energy transducer TonB [Flavobacterium sp.]|nr:MAG: energy transducer TonB [Flavobacterium sp.]
MKLDILGNRWLDIVFEGRNKLYGAYQLRKQNPKTTLRALLIGAIIFSFLLSLPILANFLPDKSDNDDTLDKKIVTIKLPPKQPEVPKNLPPPPPPPPKVDQVKFVKPVVAKKEEVVEEPPKIKEIVEKKIGNETIKGDPDAPLTVEPVGNGPADVVEDNTIYNTAGIEVKPQFPGGIEAFYNFIRKNYTPPDEPGLKGNVFVSFVVEKDGSLTDIKVLRDIGFGTKEEAIRVLKKCPRWTPAEQNGKRVRCSYQLPIKIQTPE